LKMIKIFVDGSPGPREGGWSGWGACMIIGDTLVREACGTLRGKVTNNVAELEAVIRGVVMAGENGEQTEIWTDSQYVANSVRRLPYFNSQGWQKGGRDIINRPQIEFLYDLFYEFEWVNFLMVRWIRGHAGHKWNERADKLSKLAAYKGENMDKAF